MQLGARVYCVWVGGKGSGRSWIGLFGKLSPSCPDPSWRAVQLHQGVSSHGIMTPLDRQIRLKILPSSKLGVWAVKIHCTTCMIVILNKRN